MKTIYKILQLNYKIYIQSETIVSITMKENIVLKFIMKFCFQANFSGDNNPLSNYILTFRKNIFEFGIGTFFSLLELRNPEKLFSFLSYHIFMAVCRLFFDLMSYFILFHHFFQFSIEIDRFFYFFFQTFLHRLLILVYSTVFKSTKHNKKGHLESMKPKQIIILVLITLISFLLFLFPETYMSKQNESDSNHGFNIFKTDMFFISFYCKKPIDVALLCVNESLDQGRSYEHNNVSIYDCMFTRLSQFIGNGGVIHIDGGLYSMNISYSIFFNCSCTNYGGAIFFSSSNSNLRMICASNCSSSYYNFAKIEVLQQNLMDSLSISSCSHFLFGYYALWLSSGIQTIDSTNSSMNNVLKSSGIAVSSSFAFSYCTFSNNRASQSACIYIAYGPGIMLFVNIVHNNSPSFGVIHIYEASPKIHFSIFDMNQNVLFYISGGDPEIAHCFINHTGVSLSGVNNTFSQRSTYYIQFFSSFFCYADNPIPKRTHEETTQILTIPRTFDFECEFIIISGARIEKNGDFLVFPILLSMLLVSM